MVWIFVGAGVLILLLLVWWRDRHHHLRVDQKRVHDGVTQQWDREAFMSRRDYYRD
jgi:hypothetical protein